MTTALITGITGMVGSHLTDYLLDNTDWDVVGLARWRSPLDNIEHHLDRINRGDRIQLVYGDLRDYVSIQRAIETSKPDFPGTTNPMIDEAYDAARDAGATGGKILGRGPAVS